MRRLWHDHSLSIVLASLGAVAFAYSATLDPGQQFDVVISLASGIWTVALYNGLSGPLRERNKPEE